MTIMTYKGYTADVEIDPDAKVLAGRVLYLRDVIVFEGETVEDAEQQFHLSVDEYLAWAAENGFEPNRPYSGKLPFRTTPEHHRKIALAAAQTGKSINAWMDDVVTQAADTVLDGRSLETKHAARS
ncbi:MAG: type II toxin-antitoxin system HicB family antitoxin [Chloroflexota bacterium]|nr:type II toxin-antitoxin system HicB family antitoxin [Chloroflexota bacterium]